jgi:hypothetical protein
MSNAEGARGVRCPIRQVPGNPSSLPTIRLSYFHGQIRTVIV